MASKDTTKAIYFLLQGTFCIYYWNSILNLNAYFVENFDDINIPKIYTTGYFIFTVFSFYMTLYIDKHFNIYKFIRGTFIIATILFNLIYFLCQFVPNGPVKKVVFFLFMMSLGVNAQILNNLTSGLCSRFEDKDIQRHFIGVAFSGLFTNGIMFVDLLGSRSTDNSMIYRLFLVIGDVLFVLFMLLQTRFFNLCKQNAYRMRKPSVVLSGKLSSRGHWD